MYRNFTKYRVLIPWLFVFLSFLLLLCLFLISSNKNSGDNRQMSVDEIIQAVGELIVLPDETPTVATVTDLDRLIGQVFFKNAKVGDKVLIYTKAQKAVLYDPISNKIVELAPLNTYNNQMISR